jgi:subtilisin-like proprotein convertase family protein
MTNSLWSDALFVPYNAVSLTIAVLPNTNSPIPFPDLPIYVKQSGPPTNTPGGYDLVGTNIVNLPPGAALTPVGVTWFYAVGNSTNVNVSFDVSIRMQVTNSWGNYLTVLSNMNEGLGPFYRYESGTSMAAADVSGTLALIKEFFEQKLSPPHTNSPALMKGLLINGARSVGNLYDFQVGSVINFQGWGCVNMLNSIGNSNVTFSPNVPASMVVVDQDATNAVATGQSQTYTVSLNNQDAQALPLKITLVWTDPPGNPVAGIKLVNDLDLIVTNLETKEVFFGNDIANGNDYNLAWDFSDTNVVPPLPDRVNNVENVFLTPTLGTNYSITVVGRRVNVNAVTAHPDNVAQDYALVIASGNGEVSDAVVLSSSNSVSTSIPLVTVITNQFGASGSTDVGGVMRHQHVGANPALLGTNQLPLGIANGEITMGITNQWHFYVITNDTSYTNALFTTFLPPNLALPRMGTWANDVADASRVQADIDLYVSMDSGLTNLDPAVLSSAWKSIGRGGIESVVRTNATSGVYYIGVKSEDAMAAEFALLAVFSALPFSDNDGWVRCFPLPQVIPDGSPLTPGQATVFGFSTAEYTVRRVIVSNIMTHELMGDLFGTLSHEGRFVALNNHTTNTLVVNRTFVYDDSSEGNTPGSQFSDGPGSLMDFGGHQGFGLWTMDQVDNALGHTGRVDFLRILLEKQEDLTKGILATLAPGACRVDYIDVPPEATNLTVIAVLQSGTGPIGLRVCRLDSADCVSGTNGPAPAVTIDYLSNPPLVPGTYAVRTCNLGPDAAQVYIRAFIYSNPSAVAVSVPSSTGPIRILDDAVTYATIDITNHMRISDLDIGLLIQHPRISDLAVTLVSPTGKRIVLFEDRGAWTTNGLGSFGMATNSLGVPIYGYTTLTPIWTNDFDRSDLGSYAAGTIFQGWHVMTNKVFVEPDWSWPWVTNHFLALSYGAVSNTIPTTNSTDYRLTFQATHAPYLAGTVGWWPMDGDGSEILNGLSGLLLGDVVYFTGKVHQAYYGDGVATRMMVPRCPEIDVGSAVRNGVQGSFSIEGWVYPTQSALLTYGPTAMADGFENTPAQFAVPAGSFLSGWLVESGDVDVLSSPTNGFVGLPDSGLQALDLNGFQAGSISTNFSTIPGRDYLLSFAYTKNPSPSLPGYPDFVASAAVAITGQPGIQLAYSARNSYTNLNWAHTSIVFTASAPLTKLQLTSLNSGNGGMYLDSFRVNLVTNTLSSPMPLVEWCDLTNSSPEGVQFWVAGIATNSRPGSLWLRLWDTNSQAYEVFTPANAITNSGWQHVAVSYDAATLTARIYTNGAICVERSSVAPGRIVPRTQGDLYFGFDPVGPAGKSFAGGLDEFGLYNRALTPCEVNAIFLAGSAGKYGTNALICPVSLDFTLSNSITSFATNIVLPLNGGPVWTNGPWWERVQVDFANSLLQASTNGPGTNLTLISLSSTNPNVAVDEFVLSALVTNQIDGLLHFSEDTNRSIIPIKFAPAPYAATNFPPVLLFSNSFEYAAVGAYASNSVLPGSSNGLAVPVMNWTNNGPGPITLVRDSALDPDLTNSIALGTNSISSSLPTIPGHKYSLTYRLRGPGAVGWWNGSINPYDNRAMDLISGNDGAFINLATNSTGPVDAYVGTEGLFFPGMIQNGVDGNPDIASKIEIGDPDMLHFTNGFTIEGWIKPLAQTNSHILSLLGASNSMDVVLEQIFFRGDQRQCQDPFYLCLEQISPSRFDIIFQIDGTNKNDCGVLLEAPDAIGIDEWQHVAAVFEPNVAWTNNPPWPTNELRIYVKGLLVTNSFLEDPSFSTNLVPTSFTSRRPSAELDPAYNPGIAIGNRSRSEAWQPFRGYMDELTVYGRPLTGPEVLAIASARREGKADRGIAPAQSLAKLNVYLDNRLTDSFNGDNGEWTSRSFVFTARSTNETIRLESLLPGTIIDSVTLTEVSPDLSYLPEEPLAPLIGEDAFGRWRLEIWDNRAGATNGGPTLVNWQLNFRLLPLNPPPVIFLEHGVNYTNTIIAHGSQNFVVEVPQWALWATNNLLFATERNSQNPLSVGLLYDTNYFPVSTNNALFWPPVNAGVRVLSTNGVGGQFLIPGYPYYLTVTNTNSISVTFALGVTFDITTLTNCQLTTNMLTGPAGVPRYFQFDVPPAQNPFTPQAVSFWVTGARSNLTVVLSEHLPLPDPGHWDYISQQPCTNDEIVMVVTNSTPFPIQPNRWYVGVFSSAATNVEFAVRACVTQDYPALIELTNAIPYLASLNTNRNSMAPPGPPQWLFFTFDITNDVESVLFELYGMGGDGDLVVERYLPPVMAPYLAESVRLGTTPEQVVRRKSFDEPDLRGTWYLGVYNNETNRLSYTLRASTNDLTRMLKSGQPLNVSILSIRGLGPLIGWNAIEGENYQVQFANTLLQPIPWKKLVTVEATTPFATYQVPVPARGLGFYRVVQVQPPPLPPPPITVRQINATQLRVSWPTSYPGLLLQYAVGQSEVWFDWDAIASPIVVIGNEYVTIDTIGTVPKYYRLTFP